MGPSLHIVEDSGSRRSTCGSPRTSGALPSFWARHRPCLDWGHPSVRPLLSLPSSYPCAASWAFVAAGSDVIGRSGVLCRLVQNSCGTKLALSKRGQPLSGGQMCGGGAHILHRHEPAPQAWPECLSVVPTPHQLHSKQVSTFLPGNLALLAFSHTLLPFTRSIHTTGIGRGGLWTRTRAR